jgi:16S rRNA C967 or C1407 C5-methylase (RsmB/RsmF family)
MVYATCSLEPEENEAIVATLPPGFTVLSTHLRLPGRDPGDGPKGDGFFGATITGLA